MNIKRLELFNIALETTRKKFEEFPSYFILKTIMAQLTYLIKIEEGKEKDLSDLNNIILGRITAYDIDNLDMNLASILHKVSAEVPFMQKEYMGKK